MYTREVSEVLHVGWPDPNWVRGFSVIIQPLVEFDQTALQEVMTTEDLEGVEPILARNTFDDTCLHQLGDKSKLLVVRNTLHCGMLGSQMHSNALASLNFRLDKLLA